MEVTKSMLKIAFIRTKELKEGSRDRSASMDLSKDLNKRF